jgi:hypothetical protein
MVSLKPRPLYRSAVSLWGPFSRRLSLHLFSISEVDGGEWSALSLGRCIAQLYRCGALSIGGWMDPRTGVGFRRRKKLRWPSWDSNTGSFSPYSSPYGAG